MDTPTLQAIYKPDELAFLRDFSRLSAASRGAERIAGNPSGTAQSVITFEMGRAVIRDIPHPSRWLNATSYLMTPKVLAKIYNSEANRRLFMQAFRTAADSPTSPQLVFKLMMIGGGDLVRQDQ